MGLFTRWSEERKQEFIDRMKAGERPVDIRRAMNLNPNQFAGINRRLRPHNPRKKWTIDLSDDHPAVVEGRTIFPSTVKHIQRPVLKSGDNSHKLGEAVTKGAWKGMPIYALTLEERRTCPRSCLHWNDCFGNHMHHAARQPAGIHLERVLFEELSILQRKHPDGFVVRLHVLGDFYSPLYIRTWTGFMMDFPALRVFGYTAHAPDTPIGLRVHRNNKGWPDRWVIRFSDGPVGYPRTGPDGIVCPAQTGKTQTCGTCALCWSTTKPIRFLKH